ncbi:hypothetical protein HCJ76_44100 [Streptomyces sp. MC1]|uniref:hypothetical protein n=1 Tax=Streptomyces sp. MC1 TaxID=295105 RepID=UPI0018C97BEB|nr:hypothetical protein [Streptomyces sp. MC1]MBG7704867.1 hypothetical protein [Streptomyces sp. MC1]
MTAAPPTYRPLRPLDVDQGAYALSPAGSTQAAAPVSRALVRAVVAVVLRTGGRAEELAAAAVQLQYAGGRRALLAVPCARPPRTAECARCGHWEAEHGHPAVVSACNRYRLRLGRPRFKTPEHDAVSYAWVRRIGRARLVFELGEPCEVFPGGTLTVHRYPAPGDGRAVLGAHRWPIPVERRTWWLDTARAHVAGRLR